MKKADACKKCGAEGFKEVTEKERVAIDVGTPEEHVMKFVGKGNEIPDALAGDLYIKVNIKKHKTFTRKGADLFIEKEITLKQALLGKLRITARLHLQNPVLGRQGLAGIQHQGRSHLPRRRHDRQGQGHAVLQRLHFQRELVHHFQGEVPKTEPADRGDQRSAQ